MKQHSSSPGTVPGSLHPVPGPPWEFCAIISPPQIRRQGLRWGKRRARKPQLRILVTVGIPPKPGVVSAAQFAAKGSGPWGRHQRRVPGWCSRQTGAFSGTAAAWGQDTLGSYCVLQLKGGTAVWGKELQLRSPRQRLQV